MIESKNFDRAGCPLGRKDVAAFPLDEELVLCKEDDGQVFVLNQTGVYIWSLCDGAHHVSDIAQAITDTFGIPLSQAVSDVAELIDALIAAGLLNEEEPMSTSSPQFSSD